MENHLMKSVNLDALNQPINNNQATEYANEHKLNTINASVFLKWGSFIVAVFFLFVAVVAEEIIVAIPVIFFVIMGFVFHGIGKKKSIMHAKEILRQSKFAKDNHWDYHARMEGNGGFNGSEFKPDDYGMHSLIDFYRAPNFSFGIYNYATGSSGSTGHAGSSGWTLGVIVVPLSYHLPNRIYMMNQAIHTGNPLVNKYSQAKSRDIETGEMKRLNVHKMNVSPQFDKLYSLFVQDIDAADFIERMTEEVIQVLTHLKYQYNIEVIQDKIYMYATSSTGLENKLFKTSDPEDVTEILELIWRMAEIFQIEDILAIPTK